MHSPSLNLKLGPTRAIGQMCGNCYYHKYVVRISRVCINHNQFGHQIINAFARNAE